MEDLRKKVSKKIHTLARVTPYMTTSKRRILMNTFFRSQFSYCQLVCMFHSRTILTINNKKDFTKGALNLFSTISFQSFQKLLDQDR